MALYVSVNPTSHSFQDHKCDVTCEARLLQLMGMFPVTTWGDWFWSWRESIAAAYKNSHISAEEMWALEDAFRWLHTTGNILEATQSDFKTALWGHVFADRYADLHSGRVLEEKRVVR